MNKEMLNNRTVSNSNQLALFTTQTLITFKSLLVQKTAYSYISC